MISVMKCPRDAARAGAPSSEWLEYINHSNDKQAWSLRPISLVRAGQCEKADARFSCREAASPRLWQVSGFPAGRPKGSNRTAERKGRKSPAKNAKNSHSKMSVYVFFASFEEPSRPLRSAVRV
jgi:hypothetical protein